MPKPRILSLIIPFFLFSFTLTVYVLTLSRSIYFGDSGEFIAVAKTLGIAHPPGYPLYTMLAHLFTYLPFGNVAFRVNLFSAVTSSLTVVVIYFICLKLTKSRLASASASLFLAFSYLFWLYSLVAEVRSLNTLFIVLLTLIALQLAEKPHNPKLLAILTLIFALSLANHFSILYLIPALIVLLFNTIKFHLVRPKSLLIIILFLTVGLLPYLYLPIRASQNPAYNWGDPDTLPKFLNHILRLDYGGVTLGAGTSKNSFNLDLGTFYFHSLAKNFTPIGLLITVFGLFFAFLAAKRRASFLLTAFLFLGPIFTASTKLPILGSIGAMAIIEKFFTASYTFFAIFLAIGMASVINFLPRPWQITKYATTLVFLIPLFFFFPRVDQSKNYSYEEFGRKAFDILPQNSILLVASDRGAMISNYLQLVENRRTDLKIVNFTLFPAQWYKEYLKQRYPDLNLPWDKFTSKTSQLEAAKTICLEVTEQYPTFIDDFLANFAKSNNKDCVSLPYGPLIKLEQHNSKLTKELTALNHNFWHSYVKLLKSQNPPDLRTQELFWTNSIVLTFFGVSLDDSGQREEAKKLYEESWTISEHNSAAADLLSQYFQKNQDFDSTIYWKHQALKADPTSAPTHKSLGLLYLEQKNDKKKAYYHLRKYLNLAGGAQDNAQIEEIVNKLKNEI